MRKLKSIKNSLIQKTFIQLSDSKLHQKRVESELKVTRNRIETSSKGGRNSSKSKQEINKNKHLVLSKDKVLLETNTNTDTITNIKEKINKKEKYCFEEYKESMKLWLEYKKDIKNNYKSEKSIKECFENLKRLSGNDPIIAMKVVKQSMANNWKGLFKLKEEKNNESEYSTFDI